MKSPAVGLRVASVIFAFVCFGHVVRLWARWEVNIGGHQFGNIPSLFVVVVCALLSVWMWSLSNRKTAALAPQV